MILRRLYTCQDGLTHVSPVLRFILKPVICFVEQTWRETQKVSVVVNFFSKAAGKAILRDSLLLCKFMFNEQSSYENSFLLFSLLLLKRGNR